MEEASQDQISQDRGDVKMSKLPSPKTDRLREQREANYEAERKRQREVSDAVAHAESTLAAHPNVPSVAATLRTIQKFANSLQARPKKKKAKKKRAAKK
jgi:hypothetical protein